MLRTPIDTFQADDCCLMASETFAGDDFNPDTIEIVYGDWAVADGAATSADPYSKARVLGLCTPDAKLILRGDSTWDGNEIRAMVASNPDLSTTIEVRAKWRPADTGFLGRIEITVASAGVDLFEMDFPYGDYELSVSYDSAQEILTVETPWDDPIYGPSTFGQSFPVELLAGHGGSAGFGTGDSSDVNFTEVELRRVKTANNCFACDELAVYNTCWQGSPCGLSPLGNEADPSYGVWDWYPGTPNDEWTLADLSATWDFPGKGDCGPDNLDTWYQDRIFRVTARGGSVDISGAVNGASVNAANSVVLTLEMLCPHFAETLEVWSGTITTTPSGGDCGEEPCAAGDNASGGTTINNLPLGFYRLTISSVVAGCVGPTTSVPPTSYSGSIAGVEIMEACE